MSQTSLEKINFLVSHAKADVNLCVAAFQIIKRASVEDRADLLEIFIRGFRNRSTDGTLEIPEVMSSETEHTYLRRYQRIVDGHLEELLNDFKIDYDIILIDNTSNYEYKYLSRILNSADTIFYLVVPTKIELKKSMNLLEVFIEDFKVNLKKFEIVLNKVNSASLNKELLYKALREIPITRSIEYDENIEKNIMNNKY